MMHFDKLLHDFEVPVYDKKAINYSGLLFQ